VSVRLLGIDFSPREGSNSGLLLERSFERLVDAYQGEVTHEVIHLRDLHLESCRYCDVCGKTKDGRFVPCIMAAKDDVQSVLDAMVAADGLVVATPVYFGLPSDLFSSFIMRTRVLRHQDFRLANRPVGVMAIAARRSGGAETAIMSAWLPSPARARIWESDSAAARSSSTRTLSAVWSRDRTTRSRFSLTPATVAPNESTAETGFRRST
jgi:multimeric flavodoxin WrbA